jgi:hypothetical protein
MSQLPTASQKITEGRRKRCQSLKAAYGSLYSHVSHFLHEADQRGRLAVGVPDDEYDPIVSGAPVPDAYSIHRVW